MTDIHKTAIVNASADLAEDVSVGPYTIIEGEVRVDAGTRIGPHVLLASGTRIGKNCRIFNGAVLGTQPQDLKYAGEKTTLEIGDNTIIREFATMNRGTSDHWKTVIGENCLFMAYSHVAHDCIIGNNVILANSVNLAGHITIDDFVGVGGLTPIHQFVHIGKHAFIGGGFRVPKDIPPFILAMGEPLRFGGLNTIGLKRRGFSDELLARIKKAYRIIYNSKLLLVDALKKIEDEIEPVEEITYLVSFFRDSERGVIR